MRRSAAHRECRTGLHPSSGPATIRRWMAPARAHKARVESITPPIDDPFVVHREFRRHRRKRLARLERRLEVKRAKRRFWILLGGLFMFAVFLGVTIWEQIQSMFGI